MTRATYVKLQDGNWGIRVKGGAPAPGAQIRVMKKMGTVKVETVDRVVWRGDGVALCSIRRSGRSGRSAGGPDRCAECRGPIVHARHHRAMGGLCGSCAFDEFDC